MGFDFDRGIKVTIQEWSDKERFKNFMLEKFRYSKDLKIEDFNFDGDVFYVSKLSRGCREIGFALMNYRKDVDIYFNYSIENIEP